jgi:hypothetical protein
MAFVSDLFSCWYRVWLQCIDLAAKQDANCPFMHPDRMSAPQNNGTQIDFLNTWFKE